MKSNEIVAQLFEEYADILAAQGEDYRPRSYRRAAENIRSHPQALETLVEAGQSTVEEIDGVGESLAGKIIEYVETGEISTIAEAKEEFPVEMDELTRVEGVGPKTVGKLYRNLDIRTLDDLEAAAEAGEIRSLDGFGQKTEANILDNIPFARQAGERILLGTARPIVEDLQSYLREDTAVQRCAPAGSLRRWTETVGDIDVLAAGEDHQGIVDRLTDYPDAETIEAGSAKASVRIDGRQVDLRVVDPDEWGSAIQYFTGSKDHNVKLRTRALAMDRKVNEYGVFDISAVDDPDADQRVGERLAGATEPEVYAALDLDCPPPELREATGEIEAAESDDLPELVTGEQLRGDLHVHTDWSDGRASIQEMIAVADEIGYDYIAVTDHADGAGVPADIGLTDAEIDSYQSAIRSAAAEAPIEVFAGIEANIDVDGNLGVAESTLAGLDFVVASPHSGLDGSGTDRLVSAIEHPHVDVIGHPTGRLLNQRSGLDIDIESVAETAAQHEVALEINADPRRLDLRGEAVRIAIEAGAVLSVGTDAHGHGAYDNMRFGVHTARRGWAEPADLLNTWAVSDVREFIA